MHEPAAGQDTQNSWPVGITGFGLGVTDHPDPRAAAAGSARSSGWPLGSDTFARAGAGRAVTASEATTTLARPTRTMTRRLQAGLSRTRPAALATLPIPHKSLRMMTSRAVRRSRQHAPATSQTDHKPGQNGAGSPVRGAGLP